jgi:hypothetical protein
MDKAGHDSLGSTESAPRALRADQLAFMIWQINVPVKDCFEPSHPLAVVGREGGTTSCNPAAAQSAIPICRSPRIRTRSAVANFERLRCGKCWQTFAASKNRASLRRPGPSEKQFYKVERLPPRRRKATLCFVFPAVNSPNCVDKPLGSTSAQSVKQARQETEPSRRH